MNELSDTLALILASLTRIESQLAGRAAAAPAAPRQAMTPVSSDRPANDAKVTKDPRAWKGPSQVGNNLSQCPPEYLDQLAQLWDWMADKDDEAGKRGEQNAKGYTKDGKWKRQDAHLARCWAQHLRATPKVATQDDLPF